MTTRILVVEDSPTQAEALKAHLESAGYGVLVAAAGEEALQVLARNSIDLVLSDIVMPGSVDGYELCRRLKAGEYRELPVVLLTSLSDPMDIIRGLECGADNFLTKPYHPKVLLERIDLLLKNRRLRAGERLKTGVKVLFMGREYVITSEREQILDLLVTTFEEAVQQNRELRQREEELTRARNELARYAKSLEAQLERIMRSVPDVIFSFGPGWQAVHYVSPAVEQVFGCKPEEFTFEYWRARILTDDRDRVVQELETAVRRRSPSTVEYRFSANGRGSRWISQTVIPVLEDQHITRLDAIARDVTERRKTEARLRRMVESGIVGVIFWDTDGTLLDANDEFLRIMGYTRDDILSGRVRWKDMTPAEWEARDAQAFAEIAATGRFSPFRKESVRKDGSRVPILVSGASFEGTPDQGVALVLDLTEQVRSEEGLRDSEERVRLLLESTAEGIYGLDLEGNCTFCNPAAVRFLGYDDPTQLLGRNMHALIHHTRPDGSPYRAEECPIDRAFKQGTGTHVVDEPLWRADGTAFPTEYWSYPIRWAGEIVGCVVTFVDITERKNLEQQVRQSQKLEAVGRLAGGVAHDFNNLLTVIMGESDLALMATTLDSEVKQSLEEVRRAADRAKLLTRQLLTFSRREVVQPTAFNLNDVVQGMEVMLRRLIGEDVAPVIHLAPDLATVRADRSQVEQVLMNLVVNARDAMPEGGALVIETANVTLSGDYADLHADVEPGGYVMLAVSDSGSGMSEEVKAHLFEPFFTTKAKDKGTGLGLATSYGIVQQSGGHIGVYSELGVGTTMKVYLPRVASTFEAEVDDLHTPVPNGDETMLLVEDDEHVRHTVAHLLRARGYTVLEADDGPAARSMAESHDGPIHLLLTDVVLPTTGGRQLAEQIQGARPDIAVLFASGYTDDVILQHKLLERDVALIQKPFTPDALARKVRDVLDAGSRHSSAVVATRPDHRARLSAFDKKSRA